MNTVDGQTILTICLSALIFFSLGSLAGWLMSLLRAPKKTSTASNQSTSTQSTAETSSNMEKIELARIYRRREDDQVVLEANGRPLHTPADIHPDERTWLVLTTETIYRLLEQVPAPAEPTPSSQPTAAAPRIGWQPAQPQETRNPSMNPADVLIRAAQAGQAKPSQPKSLVEQIDEVLQEMLAQSPLPAGEIHLAENADLGLEVRLGSQYYDGIEAVPDENARQIIRAAIAEWQRRSF